MLCWCSAVQYSAVGCVVCCCLLVCGVLYCAVMCCGVLSNIWSLEMPTSLCMHPPIQSLLSNVITACALLSLFIPQCRRCVWTRCNHALLFQRPTNSLPRSAGRAAAGGGEGAASCCSPPAARAPGHGGVEGRAKWTPRLPFAILPSSRANPVCPLPFCHPAGPTLFALCLLPFKNPMYPLCTYKAHLIIFQNGNTYL